MIRFFAATASGSRCRGRGHLDGYYRLHRAAQPPFVFVSQIDTIIPTGRSYSSTSKSEQDHERKWKLLYHRNPPRTTYPRALLGISSFNFTYWSWYCMDFTPSVNAAANAKAALGQIDAATLERLLIDPNMGYVGLGMASIIWLGSFLYTKQLVSAIWAPIVTSAGEGKSALAVSTFKLPFLRESKILQKTVYDPETNAFDHVENIEFTESELRSESSVQIYAPGELTLSEEQRKNDAIVKFDGEFSKLKGHVALRTDGDGAGESDGPLANVLKQKYLLEIESEQEIMPSANTTLLNTLVLKDYHLKVLQEEGRKISKKAESMKGRKRFRKRR